MFETKHVGCWWLWIVFADNKIGAEGARDISKALEQNSTLQHLYLGCACIAYRIEHEWTYVRKQACWMLLTLDCVGSEQDRWWRCPWYCQGLRTQLHSPASRSSKCVHQLCMCNPPVPYDFMHIYTHIVESKHIDVCVLAWIGYYFCFFAQGTT